MGEFSLYLTLVSVEKQFDPNIHFANNHLLIDVRSPGEFKAGHIPGAVSLPLFTDDERAEVGTIYKRQGKDKAVHKGLEFVGPKMASFVEQGNKWKENHTLTIYCWRGGMRSGSMQWLFNTAGIPAGKIHGGYKNFRHWSHRVIEHYAEQAKWYTLSGMTGSGKTEILHSINDAGHQILDLEGLANHRGSAFGHLLLEDQPSTEHYINKIAVALYQHNIDKPIWIEDESRLVGHVVVPPALYEAKQNAHHVFVDMPNQRRVAFLVEEYGKAPKGELEQAFINIKKRLGGQHLNTALEALKNNDLSSAASVALTYYDKAYKHSIQHLTENKIASTFEEFTEESFGEIAQILTSKYH